MPGDSWRDLQSNMANPGPQRKPREYGDGFHPGSGVSASSFQEEITIDSLVLEACVFGSTSVYRVQQMIRLRQRITPPTGMER